MKRVLGYADESGEPGIKKNNNDYFVFCVVLVKNRDYVKQIEEKIANFRRACGLSFDHEFHYATDSKKTRNAFISFIKYLDFEYISVSIKKNSLRSYASFARISDLTLKIIQEEQINADVLMDTNPRLCRELRSRKKKYVTNSYFKERKSHASDLIQLADYVVALRTRYLKHSNQTGVIKAYSSIADKILSSVEL